MNSVRTFVTDSTLVNSVCPERLAQIPASMRRRLSAYSKLIFTAILDLAERQPKIFHMPVVLASRHGDLQRTEKLLRALVRGESLSPTQFGLSVNNAVLGQYSLAVNNKAAMTTVSGGEQTYPLGWLEAVSQVQNEAEAVLLIIADEPPPDVYQSQESSPKSAFSHAVLLHRHNGKEVIMDQPKLDSCDIDVAELAQQVQNAISEGEQKVSMRYGKTNWCWHVR